MKKKMFYRERTWICGHYKEIQIFPVYQKPGVRRSKCKPSSDIQKKLNDKHSRAHFMRLVHLNFKEDDLMIGLDYTDNCLPDDDAMAKRDVQNWVRRVRRLYSSVNCELKYITVYERAENGRPHFHVLINNAGFKYKTLRNLWHYGRTEIDEVQYDNTGIVGLSKYYTKNKLFYRRWSGSKNLKQPKCDDADYKWTHKAVEAFKIEDPQEIHKRYGEGCILDCKVENNEINRADYINIVLFDFNAFCDEIGKQPYTRLKNVKFTARRHARE